MLRGYSGGPAGLAGKPERSAAQEYRYEGENMLKGWATHYPLHNDKPLLPAETLFYAGQSMGWHRATWSEALERIDRLLDSKLDANRMKFGLDRFRQQIRIDCNPRIDHQVRNANFRIASNRKLWSRRTTHDICNGVFAFRHPNRFEVGDLGGMNR